LADQNGGVDSAARNQQKQQNSILINTAAFTHRSIQQRVCFNLEFDNRSYTTSDVYTFDVSLDFTILDVSTRRYRALMGNTR